MILGIRSEKNKKIEIIFRISFIVQKMNTLDGRYILGKQIGQGTHGKVHILHHRRLPLKYAVKIVPKGPGYHNIQRELSIMKQLQTVPQVVRLYSVSEDEMNVYMVMEKLQNTLREFYEANEGPLSEAQVRRVVYEIVLFLNRCHNYNIIYGDMKMENFMFSKRGELRVVDFGCSKRLRSATDKYHAIIGTPVYIAPEVFLRDLSFPSDMWSLGILMYMLLLGKHPFIDTRSPLLSWDELEEVMITPAYIGYHTELSLEANDFLQGLLQYDPEYRMTASEALKHPFLDLKK